MVNLNIDELIVESKNDSTNKNLYGLKVILNSNKPDNPNPVISSSFNTDKIILDTKNATDKERIIFDREYDFTEHADGRSKEKVDLEVWLKDDTASPSRKKGGVLVIDTIYPPPTGPKSFLGLMHANFSKLFDIVSILCKRDTTKTIDTFDVSVIMRTTKDFSYSSIAIIEDMVNTSPIPKNKQMIFACYVTGSGNETHTPKYLTFSTKVDFDIYGAASRDYSNGMPIIIMLEGTTFSKAIDVKKGTIVVKNTELLPLV